MIHNTSRNSPKFNDDVPKLKLEESLPNSTLFLQTQNWPLIASFDVNFHSTALKTKELDLAKLYQYYPDTIELREYVTRKDKTKLKNRIIYLRLQA